MRRFSSIVVSRAGAQHVADGGGDRAAAGDDQHVLAVVVGAHVVQRAGHAGDEVAVAGHAARAARCPPSIAPGRRAAGGSGARYISGEVGFCSLSRVHGGDHRLAVVFVQAFPGQVLAGVVHALAGCRPASACGGAGCRRSAPSKWMPLLGEVLAQAHALAVAELAQLVVVVGAERGLAVAHEVEGSHARILAKRAGAAVPAATASLPARIRRRPDASLTAPARRVEHGARGWAAPCSTRHALQRRWPRAPRAAVAACGMAAAPATAA